MTDFVNKYFKLKENKTTIRTELIAGVTTFVTMVYILAVNPSILSATGMDMGGLFTATALMCIIGTAFMGLVAKYPFALAPGMGLNAYFAYVVVSQVGWYTGLFLLVVQGILFMALALVKFREKIFDQMPKNLKLAIGVAVGLFIAHIGLQNSGFIGSHPATLVTLGNIKSVTTVIFMIGCVLCGILIAKRVKGGLFLGILGTYIVGLIAQLIGWYVPGEHGYSLIPSGFVSMPPSLSEVNLITNMDKVSFADLGWFAVITLILVLFIIDLIDTVGTVIGVSEKAGFLDENGTLPRKGRVLFSDAMTTTLGGLLGTSTTTTYIESATGIQAGGRTGLTALTTAGLFLVAMFFWPIFAVIPGFATAPALVIVGLFMCGGLVSKIDFSDLNFTEAFPAFLVVILMPLTYSISDGIVFGVLSYVLLKTLTGKIKDVSPMMWVLAVIFVLKLVF
jgi:AGZA family xanthine/uracil permease-like MFS transporter